MFKRKQNTTCLWDQCADKAAAVLQACGEISLQQHFFHTWTDNPNEIFQNHFASVGDYFVLHC